MKKIFLLLLCFVAAFACKRKLNPKEIETQLKTAMYKKLMADINYDSSRVKFDVKDVRYFEEKRRYDCEFTVSMHESGRNDTTGTMGAYISKDFSQVKRRF